MLSILFWTIFLNDFGQCCIDKMWAFQCVLNELLLVVGLFLICYGKTFMLSLSDNNQAGVIKAFNSAQKKSR